MENGTWMNGDLPGHTDRKVEIKQDFLGQVSFLTKNLIEIS